jgi:hypothetical protein
MVLEAFSVSYGKASAYLPVIELLRNYFRIANEDDERTRREKVNGKVLTLDRSLEDSVPYLFALLGIAGNEDSLGHGFSPSLVDLPYDWGRRLVAVGTILERLDLVGRVRTVRVNVLQAQRTSTVTFE